MISLLKKNLTNLGYHFKIRDRKILKYNSHNNDIKVSFNNKFKIFRKETETAYGKKLIRNEISGILWISKILRSSKKGYIYQIKFSKEKSLVDLKELKGKKINYFEPLTSTKLKILKVIKFYSNKWPRKKNVPCHGDLTFDNIIFSKKNINIIDWECFNKKGEFWGYDLLYLIISAATFPYYKQGYLPKEDQKILRNLWKRLKNLGLEERVLNDPIRELKKTFKKKHWKFILKRSPKKLYPMIIKNNFANHINSIIN